MIKIKLSSLGKGTSLSSEAQEGDTLKSAVDRLLSPYLKECKAEDSFQVLLNGKRISHDLWEATKIYKTDVVLIAPIIKGGDNSLLRAGLTLVAIAASAYIAGPAYLGLEGWAATTFTAAGTIAAGLLINGLIPQTVPNLSTPENAASGSQMYTISGQSNSIKQYGNVPKVYGRHRIFPNVAANPYTELESRNGNLVQYYYAIYDLGFGPGQVSDIKIGNTPIEDFDEQQYRIVDPNRPDVDEGPWDARVYKTFDLYKGDNSSEQVGVNFTGNRSAGGPVDTWQAQRTAGDNPDNRDQTIFVDFVCPGGLYAYDTTGKIYNRTIELQIEFSKVAEENWRQFNDLNFVSDFESKGGQTNYPKYTIPGSASGDPNTLDVNTIQNAGYYALLSYGTQTSTTSLLTKTFKQRITYGYEAGQFRFVLRYDPELAIGSPLWVDGTYLGKIVEITSPLGIGIGNRRYRTDNPLKRDIALFSILNTTVLTYPPGTGYPSIVQTYTDPKRTKVTYIELRNTTTGTARIIGKSTDPVYATFKFTPKQVGEYKVRVTRVTTFSSYTFTTQDDLTWTTLTTRLNAPFIVTDKRHLFLELKILASNQLNGSIQNLSAVVESALPVYNGSTWTRAISSNPAWVVADILTGEINKKKVDFSRIDAASLKEWADFCDEIPTGLTNDAYKFPRYESNFVLDYDATVMEAIQQVSTSAKATLNIIDGKYGVLIDKYKDVPVQIFTPRNYKNFSSQRVYARQPQALDVSYVDPSRDWTVTTLTVYDNGYNSGNLTEEADEITAFGCTNSEQAWREGRYKMAQNRLRQEVITLDVDFEYLVCSRGDFVQITQDAMLAGGTGARVLEVTGNTVRLDEAIETSISLNYGYVFRSITGEIKNGTLTVVDSDEFTLDGDIPEVGDLIVIGEVSTVVFDCLVKSITPSSDLSATLTLVEKADALYTIDETDVLPVYDPKLSKTVNIDYAPPGEVEDLVVADQGYECSGAGYIYYVDLDWNLPSGSAFEIFEVYADYGRGFNLIGSTKSSLYRAIIPESQLGIEHFFKVLAVSVAGKKLDLGTVGQVSATPLRKTSAPSDVEALSIDILAETLQLSWPAVIDCDVREYLIRYSPLTGGATWEASVPLLRVDRNTTLSSTQARTGTYLIKAVDYNDNESNNVAQAITTIPNLFGLTFISSTTDFPDLNGVMDRVEKVNDTLVLDKVTSGGVETTEYYSEGYYYYEDFLDLGGIYTVRLQSLIQAEGNTAEDIMSNWITLDSVVALANSKFSEWDVEAQYRTTEQFNVMGDWVTLDSIDPISEGNQDLFSEWRKFVIGDATGRIFQFRLKLISRKASVSPRVFDGTIKADMPERQEIYSNQPCTAANGLEITYNPAFKGPSPSPNLQVTIDDASSGDHPVFAYKTTNGFKLFIHDATNTPVDRTVDVAVRGYGRKATSII